MRLRITAASALLCAFATSVASAQSGAPTPPSGAKNATPAPARNPVADAEWARVSALHSPKLGITSPVKTPSQIAALRQQRIEETMTAAREAKSFYTRFPDHPSAGTARKLEAIAMLTSLRHGNKSVESEASVAADAVRNNRTLFVSDRFEVALAVERYRMQEKRGVRTALQEPEVHEAMADVLYKEFGPVPEVFGLYLNIARRCDMDAANRLATKVLELRPSPSAKAEAEAITTMYGRVGQPWSAQLTTTVGERVTITPSKANGNPSVVYVWDNSGSTRKSPFAPLDAMKKDLSKQAKVNWYYLALQAKQQEVVSVRSKLPYDGVLCFAGGDDRTVAATMQFFRGVAGPTVFVVNGRGVLVGFGSPAELPRLLANAAR